MAGKKKDQAAVKPAAKKNSEGAVVIFEFRDTNDFNLIHKVGDDVSHFTKDRIEKLTSLGYVSGKLAVKAEIVEPDPEDNEASEEDGTDGSETEVSE